MVFPHLSWTLSYTLLHLPLPSNPPPMLSPPHLLDATTIEAPCEKVATQAIEIVVHVLASAKTHNCGGEDERGHPACLGCLQKPVPRKALQWHKWWICCGPSSGLRDDGGLGGSRTLAMAIVVDGPTTTSMVAIVVIVIITCEIQTKVALFHFRYLVLD
jgi:hypothetical protein